MTQPYPYPGPPRYGPYQVLPPRYRRLRTTAIVTVALMGVTALVSLLQSVLMWRSYDDVKNIIFLNLTEDELENSMGTMVGGGWVIQIVGYLMFGTCIAYLLWLWHARENTDFLNSAYAPRPPAQPLPPGRGLHRLESGWLVGAWFCPIVQFWYPLRIVQDVVAASEPPEQPGAAKSPRIRALVNAWWVGWVGYWVIVMTALLVGFIATIVFIVKLVESTEDSDRSVAFYGLQDVLVQVALWVDIGFTVAALLLVVAAAASALLMHQVDQWQDERAKPAPVAPVQNYYQPPSFPSYRPLS